MTNYDNIKEICINMLDSMLQGLPPQETPEIWAQKNKRVVLRNQLWDQIVLAHTSACKAAVQLLRENSKSKEVLRMTQLQLQSAVEERGMPTAVGIVNNIINRHQAYLQELEQIQGTRSELGQHFVRNIDEGTNRSRNWVAGYGGSNFAGLVGAGVGSMLAHSKSKANLNQAELDARYRKAQIEEQEVDELINAAESTPTEFSDYLISMTEGDEIDVNQRKSCQTAIQEHTRKALQNFGGLPLNARCHQQLRNCNARFVTMKPRD